MRIKEPKKPLTVRTQQSDVDTAIACHKGFCVIAQALRRGYPELSAVRVGLTIMELITGDVTYRYQTPKVLRPAIKHFDLTREWDLPVDDNYSLLPLSPGQTLKARRRNNLVRNKRALPNKRRPQRTHTADPRMVTWREGLATPLATAAR